MFPSELTNTIQQLIVYVHRNEAHFTYIYVYLRLHDNMYKNPPPNAISPIFVLLFLLRSWAPPMTLLTAGALTDQYVRLMPGWVASSGWLPHKKILDTPLIRISLQGLTNFFSSIMSMLFMILYIMYVSHHVCVRVGLNNIFILLTLFSNLFI